jgi:hypothetical protein
MVMHRLRSNTVLTLSDDNYGNRSGKIKASAQSFGLHITP